ncbi:MAG TPA: DUF4403 family protein [Polyangiaceae bacterium]|nr:DUF4403 family protein [Polyangiaceae bacterium]
MFSRARNFGSPTGRIQGFAERFEGVWTRAESLKPNRVRDAEVRRKPWLSVALTLFSGVRYLPSTSFTSVALVRHLCWALLLLVGCTRFGPVYPSRPLSHPSQPIADPAPSRVNVHLAVTHAGVHDSLEALIPTTGEGIVPILGSDRKYVWARSPLDISFASGRIIVKLQVSSSVDLPISSVDLPFDIEIAAEPVINTEYALKIQSTDVSVQSADRRAQIADQFGDVFTKISDELNSKLRDFTYDLRPMLSETYARLKAPVPLPMGQAQGCAELRVLGIEAAPLVLADGIEKDIAITVAPSITLPCKPATEQAALPALANVAMVPTGPFTVTVPIAASYQELTRALGAAFTDGKLFFSTEHPKLYLEKPEVYESDGALILALHIKGPVHELGIDADIDGDLYLVGHPALTDNEIQFPDLEPTIETSNLLLSLKALSDADRIKQQARKALRLDLSERLATVREKLSSNLTFGTAEECVTANVDKLELTELHAHASYLRVNIVATARASASLPCATNLAATPFAD